VPQPDKRLLYVSLAGRVVALADRAEFFPASGKAAQ